MLKRLTGKHTGIDFKVFFKFGVGNNTLHSLSFAISNFVLSQRLVNAVQVQETRHWLQHVYHTYYSP